MPTPPALADSAPCSVTRRNLQRLAARLAAVPSAILPLATRRLGIPHSGIRRLETLPLEIPLRAPARTRQALVPAAAQIRSRELTLAPTRCPPRNLLPIPIPPPKSSVETSSASAARSTRALSSGTTRPRITASLNLFGILRKSRSTAARTRASSAFPSSPPTRFLVARAAADSVSSPAEPQAIPAPSVPAPASSPLRAKPPPRPNKIALQTVARALLPVHPP